MTRSTLSGWNRGPRRDRHSMPVGAHEKHAAAGDVEGGVSSGQCAEGDWDEKRTTFEAVGWVGGVGGGGGDAHSLGRRGRRRSRRHRVAESSRGTPRATIRSSGPLAARIARRSRWCASRRTARLRTASTPKPRPSKHEPRRTAPPCSPMATRRLVRLVPCRRRGWQRNHSLRRRGW